MYIVDRKLGKGGFGQVYVGKRAAPSNSKEGSGATEVRPCTHCPCSKGFWRALT